MTSRKQENAVFETVPVPAHFFLVKADEKTPTIGWKSLANTEAHSSNEEDGSERRQGSHTEMPVTDLF